jgi:hypothetical protein
MPAKRAFTGRPFATEEDVDVDRVEREAQLAHVVLFTGHMIDSPRRVAKGESRFPPTLEAELRARALILKALIGETEQEGGVSLGLAGGACGGDILFHEACLELGIPTQLFLALPREDFKITSVQHGGPQWVERYNNLCERVPPRVLDRSEALPHGLTGKDGFDIWQKSNLWMLFNALALEPGRVTLLALLNPDQEADGVGGTGHFVHEASRRGVKTVVLDARKLLN